MRVFRLLMSVALLGWLTVEGVAADPLAWLPAEVNAVARINVAEVYQTPLARKEGWIKKATESFIQQESFIPPGTKQILVGAELELSDNLKSLRKYSVVVPDAQLTLEKLSAWMPISTFAGKPSTQFGNDGYVVDAGDGSWLVSESSSRQIMSRWLKNGPTSGGNRLSPYLRSAMNSKENSAQFLLAIDLQDNFSAEEIRQELKSTGWFSSDSASKSAAEVLETVKGITIAIAVDTERKGTATLEFGKDATVLKPVLEKLVAAVMNRVGAASEDIQGWKWTINGSRVTGTGGVSQGEAREMLSILEPPSITQAISASSSNSQSASTANDRMARTSLSYCKSVQVLLNDLRTTLKKERDNHALHFERYARKIDDLPMLNVDPALLNFGANVSGSLRYQAQTHRMSKIQAGTRQQQQSAGAQNFGGGFGPFGGDWQQSVIGLRDGAVDAEENQRSKQVRFSEWKQIEDGLVSVRRSMTEKYQIEF